MAETLIVIVAGVVAAYVAGILAAILTRLFRLIGARINRTELGQRLEIDDILLREAEKAVCDVEATLVKTAKAATKTGTLEKEDALEALGQAKTLVYARAVKLGKEGLYREKDLELLVEYALKRMGLSGGAVAEAPKK